MALILALDQGTTSSRALVFDHDGAVARVAQQEFPQIFPQPGWVEHDPRRSGRRSSASLREALRKAASTPRDIAAIGITNQRETTVVWDRATGEPVANAIVWQDRRTAPLCDALRAGGPCRDVRREDRPRPRPVLLRHQDRAGCSTTSRARARAPSAASSRSARSTVARLEADRRRERTSPTSQRVAHAALRHPHAATGTTSCSRCSACRARCCRRSSRRPSVYGETRRARRRATSRSPASPATSRRRCSARPASRRAWRSTPTAPAASC